MYGFIYITTNKINNKKYLGMCKYAKKNWRTYLGSGKWLRRAIKKYGSDNFKREIIVEHIDQKELSDAEIYYISKFNCVKSRDWYNIASGGYTTRGFLGKKHSEEHKKWISQKLKGRKRPPHVGIAVSKAKKGKSRTEESIEKQRQSMSGANHFRAKKVIIEGIEYPTITEAFEKTGISRGNIRKHYIKS